MQNIKDNNRFLKVLITAQRARQIHKGARPHVQISNTRATRIALEEVERGLIKFELISRNQDSISEHTSQNDSEIGATGEKYQEVTDLISVARLGD